MGKAHTGEPSHFSRSVIKLDKNLNLLRAEVILIGNSVKNDKKKTDVDMLLKNRLQDWRTYNHLQFFKHVIDEAVIAEG